MDYVTCRPVVRLAAPSGVDPLAVELSTLCDDTADEAAELLDLLASLTDGEWDRPTPAPGWSVRDQVGHLAFFDDRCHQAISDPAGFRAESDETVHDIDGLVDRAVAAARHRPPADLLAWFGRARSDMVAAARAADPRIRTPWYGPDMTVASAMTARIMETWAHGQDVADALGVTRQPTDRIRHVAFIGVRTLPNSFRARHLPVPTDPVRVELRSMAGEEWVWGPPDATDRVRGPAVDFCLAVTQRRHLADLDLDLTGPVAHQWMSAAQAYAGPPGGGRQPGQFPAR